MSSPVPRLINFSERVQQSFEINSAKQELSDLAITYRNFISEMRTRACETDSYWTFDLKIVSVDDVRDWCQSDADAVVSQQWRLIGSFEDLISLAKLAGYIYESQGREMVLPNFGPEESYWIRSLQMIKLCQEKSFDSDSIVPCAESYQTTLPKKSTLLWKTNTEKESKVKLCSCCTREMCNTSYQGSFQAVKSVEPRSCPYQPLSRIEPVKIESISVGSTFSPSIPPATNPSSLNTSPTITINPSNGHPINIILQSPLSSQPESYGTGTGTGTGTFCRLSPGGGTPFIDQLSNQGSVNQGSISPANQGSVSSVNQGLVSAINQGSMSPINGSPLNQGLLSPIRSPFDQGNQTPNRTPSLQRTSPGTPSPLNLVF